MTTYVARPAVLLLFLLLRHPLKPQDTKEQPLGLLHLAQDATLLRAGFPYSVLVPAAIPGTVRATLANGDGRISQAAPGGKILLNAADFITPVNDIGNTGRNSFAGPGLFNIDLSLSRSIALPSIGETARITFRADAFNFLNHANLNNPANYYTGANFGLAQYGRSERASGSPLLTPLTETARQVQLILRLEF
jgi:hypothetical protein